MGKTLEEMLAKEKSDVVAKAQAGAEEILISIKHGELRERVQKTQVEMALAVGIKQPTEAGMEKPGRDLKISSLKRHIEAAGGKLRLEVDLPDGIH
jgi:DNA-binding XRE family transcriptional regulator